MKPAPKCGMKEQHHGFYWLYDDRENWSYRGLPYFSHIADLTPQTPGCGHLLFDLSSFSTKRKSQYFPPDLRRNQSALAVTEMEIPALCSETMFCFYLSFTRTIRRNHHHPFLKLLENKVLLGRAGEKESSVLTVAPPLSQASFQLSR